MEIGVLTSSRADFGIYLPLLKELQRVPEFNITILAFGTHLSEQHGYTINEIHSAGSFKKVLEIDTIIEGNNPASIDKSMSKTILAFSKVWEKNSFDLVFCLGDRFEMFAACASSVPFNVKLAHYSGGEQTLGAIDDCFRHAITHMSKLHFTTCEQYKQRVIEMLGNDNNVFNIGSLSYDNIRNMNLLGIEEFKLKYNIDLSKKTILFTFHPETVSYNRNEFYIKEIISALSELNNYQIIITMPNADTSSDIIRSSLQEFVEKHPSNKYAVESFGALGYLSCMKHSTLMLGNSSSGFVEALFFGKYVINLGNRQKGRILTSNIINCEISKHAILEAVKGYSKFSHQFESNVFGNGDAAVNIVSIIKTL